MKFRIERKPSFMFYGVSKSISTKNGSNFEEIPRFWNEVMENGSFQDMMKISENGNSIGACLPINSDKKDSFEYVIGSFCKNEVSDYKNYDVEEHQWAVFELNGPISDVLQTTWKKIFNTWFPKSGYKHGHAPELEVYYPGDVNSKGYYMEIWIPIIR